jgi:hypothetical protein
MVRLAWVSALLVVFLAACSTLPTPKMTRYKWPKDAYIGEPDKPYEKLGLVRTRIEYPSLDPTREEGTLCKNYFAKAASDLVVRARKVGGDAVIDVRSAVFLFDGRAETYPSAECSDDGQEGQVLAQGIAVKWRKPGDPRATVPQAKSPTPKDTPVPAPESVENHPAVDPEHME